MHRFALIFPQTSRANESYGIVVTLLILLWASAHYLLAARGIKGDLAKRMP